MQGSAATRQPVNLMKIHFLHFLIAGIQNLTQKWQSLLLKKILELLTGIEFLSLVAAAEPGNYKL